MGWVVLWFILFMLIQMIRPKIKNHPLMQNKQIKLAVIIMCGSAYMFLMAKAFRIF